MRQKQREAAAQRLQLVRTQVGRFQPTVFWHDYLADLMSADAYRKIDRGERGLQPDHARRLVERLALPGLTIDWLLTGAGDGPDFGSAATSAPDAIPMTLDRLLQAKAWADELIRSHGRAPRSADARIEAMWKIAGILVRDDVPVDEIAARARERITDGIFHETIEPLTVPLLGRPQLAR